MTDMSEKKQTKEDTKDLTDGLLLPGVLSYIYEKSSINRKMRIAKKIYQDYCIVDWIISGQTAKKLLERGNSLQYVYGHGGPYMTVISWEST